jgi:hypothetical protein
MSNRLSIWYQKIEELRVDGSVDNVRFQIAVFDDYEKQTIGSWDTFEEMAAEMNHDNVMKFLQMNANNYFLGLLDVKDEFYLFGEWVPGREAPPMEVELEEGLRDYALNFIPLRVPEQNQKIEDQELDDEEEDDEEGDLLRSVVVLDQDFDRSSLSESTMGTLIRAVALRRHVAVNAKLPEGHKQTTAFFPSMIQEPRWSDLAKLGFSKSPLEGDELFTIITLWGKPVQRFLTAIRLLDRVILLATFEKDDCRLEVLAYADSLPEWAEEAVDAAEFLNPAGYERIMTAMDLEERD